MTSLFDQLEQVAFHGRADVADFDGFAGETDAPIFAKTKMDFTPPDRIGHVAISNKVMVLVAAGHVLLRINLHSPNERTEILLSKFTQNRLSNVFLDPSGRHTLLTFVPRGRAADASELLYLSRKSDKPKACHKMRGHEVTAVAWSRLNDSASGTGPILLGTSKGLIFEAEIQCEDEKFFSHTLEQYCKQVFDVGKNTDTPVCALDYFQHVTAARYVIMAATPTRLYYFTGHVTHPEEKPALQHVFHRYLHVPEIDTYLATDSELNYSKLQFWCEDSVTPNQFAWITERGVYYGQLDDKMTSLKETVKFLDLSAVFEDRRPPVAAAMTEFHLLLGCADSVRGVCLLSGHVVYEDVYTHRLVNVTRDVRTGDVWAVSEDAVFRFRVHREARDIWRIYCANGQFELAKKYARSDDACYNQVLIKEADVLFERGQYTESAQRYAEAHSSFEAVCLKFLQRNEQDALLAYLRGKLATLETENKTQITMIAIWAVEIYLAKLERMRHRGNDKSAAYAALSKEFEAFVSLRAVADCVRSNKTTAYELMRARGDTANLIKLLIVHRDFEALLRHHLFRNDFYAALDVLKSQTDAELFYRHAPILMREVTKATVKTLIEQGRKLSAARLLPALVACAGEAQALEVVRYLEFCVGKLKNADRAVHNLLLSLYAKFDSDKLMDYLNHQGSDLSLINYDVYFALNLCAEHGRKGACVKLYGLLGMWESAVDLALEIDLDLAKQVADAPPKADAELQKKLWLKIVKHAVSDKNDIQQAMRYFRELFDNEAIRIEDVLPFFPDFVTIDHFKDAICDSLREYNARIAALKQEMAEATRSAEQVRADIARFRNGCVRVRAAQQCDLCRTALAVRAFYLFPCGHVFHSDCLIGELEASLGVTRRSRLAELERQLRGAGQSDSASTGSAGLTTRDQIKAEIDHLVASECLYCGENMIRNIDRPFIDDYNYDSIIKEWQ